MVTQKRVVGEIEAKISETIRGSTDVEQSALLSKRPCTAKSAAGGGSVQQEQKSVER